MDKHSFYGQANSVPPPGPYPSVEPLVPILCQSAAGHSNSEADHTNISMSGAYPSVEPVTFPGPHARHPHGSMHMEQDPRLESKGPMHDGYVHVAVANQAQFKAKENDAPCFATIDGEIAEKYINMTGSHGSAPPDQYHAYDRNQGGALADLDTQLPVDAASAWSVQGNAPMEQAKQASGHGEHKQYHGYPADFGISGTVAPTQEQQHVSQRPSADTNIPRYPTLPPEAYQSSYARHHGGLLAQHTSYDGSRQDCAEFTQGPMQAQRHHFADTYQYLGPTYHHVHPQPSHNVQQQYQQQLNDIQQGQAGTEAYAPTVQQHGRPTDGYPMDHQQVPNGWTSVYYQEQSAQQHTDLYHSGVQMGAYLPGYGHLGQGFDGNSPYAPTHNQPSELNAFNAEVYPRASVMGGPKSEVVHMKRREAWAKFLAYEGCVQVRP